MWWWIGIAFSYMMYRIERGSPDEWEDANQILGIGYLGPFLIVIWIYLEFDHHFLYPRRIKKMDREREIVNKLRENKDINFDF